MSSTYRRSIPVLSCCAREEATLHIACERLLLESVRLSMSSATKIECCGILRSSSHRSIFLHCLGLSMTDSFGLSERDTFMPVVPMFHVLAWGTPFACTMLGAKLVFPGPHLTPRDLAELIQAEKVTLTDGVPTLLLGLLHLLENERYDLTSLRGMIVGGAAAPQSMIEGFEKKHGLTVIHAWGMTEMTPLGTVSR